MSSVSGDRLNNMKALLIKGGRVIDPGQGIDGVADLLSESGVVNCIGGDITPPAGASVIDATGLVVSPGFIDLHCHLRDPGFEYKETIATGTAAAAKGGFTTVCAMPNTNPVSDSRAVVDYVVSKGREEGVVRVLPIGCVTKGSEGKELAEMGDLAGAGVVGFSDDGNPVSDANIMRRALTYSTSLSLPIINHCEVPELSSHGVMNEGWISNRLGLMGTPGSAEEVMVSRDIELAKLTGGRLHIAHASTARTLELVRQAKENGLLVTCEVTPHHLTLSEEAVLGRILGDPYEALDENAYDTNAKVAPPLRSREDVAAMVEGLKSGVVDFVATDHAPHSSVDKLCTFEEAANGISGLETALGALMMLVDGGEIGLSLMVNKLTYEPARFLGMDLGTLMPGTPADVTIFDPDAEWVVNPAEFVSKGKNSPFAGATLKGVVVKTIVEGDVVYDVDTAVGECP